MKASKHLVRSQAALRRVSALVAAGEPPQTVFEAVTAEASALLDDALIALTKFDRSGKDSVVVAQTGGHVRVGARLHLTDDDGIAARIPRPGWHCSQRSSRRPW